MRSMLHGLVTLRTSIPLDGGGMLESRNFCAARRREYNTHQCPDS
jgi:hypothetical protein